MRILAVCWLSFTLFCLLCLGFSFADVDTHVIFCYSVVFGEDVADVWNYENSVEQYQSTGGTSRAMVEKQIAQLEEWIGEQS